MLSVQMCKLDIDSTSSDTEVKSAFYPLERGNKGLKKEAV